MNKPASDLESTRTMNRDGIVGLGIMAGLPVLIGLGVLGAAGPDLAHTPPLLFGIGAALIGAGLVVFNALIKAASNG